MDVLNSVRSPSHQAMDTSSSNEIGMSNSHGHVSLEIGKDDERPPKWQLELLMEKLRQKSAQLKPLSDTSKNIRQALMERRCIIDQGDKINLQKSLDSLQQSIKVNSLQSMVERLEIVARQLGLKFTPGATGHEWFISSDMFYLELIIEPNGLVEDVKIQHEGKTECQSCPDITDSLKKPDFVDFTEHLEGLVSIYQINADKKIKSKAYIALQAMEADLNLIANSYMNINDAETIVMRSLVGLFQPRKGGHPVKLVYYISPYEFLDVNTRTTLNNDVKTVLKNKLGSIATVNIQASTSHKLQMNTTVNITRTPDGKNIPRYGTLNATNSTVLPACFVLNLEKPVPICLDLLKLIHSTTEIDSFDVTNQEPILDLITHQLSNGTLDCAEKGLFVTLPDQVHCYFMTETNLEGIMISSIPFTLAAQLPQIFAILRQQLAFNTLVGSCIRIGSEPDLDHIVFEVNALSHQKLSVSFQHPLDDSLVTLEFDLRDVTHPQCRLHAITNSTDIIPTLEEHACRVVKRSMSIPITLRAVIRRWQTMKMKADPPNPDFNVGVGSSGMNMDVSRMKERPCGAESGDRRSSSSHQNVMVPPGIMNFNNTVNNSPKMPIPTSPSYSISPVNYNPNNTQQNPMDILSYMNMNPFMNLANPSFSNLTNNMAIQMLASQMGQNPTTSSQMLMGLLDQVGQTQKRRKRKNTSDNLPHISPKSSPQSIRPNQSPSRCFQKSPIRRQSDSSDGSGAEKSVMNMLMNELGMDQLPDSRWNIDITPVNSSSESMDDIDSLKKHGQKKTTPKRSMSLDSHSSEDISSIQNLMDGQDFKPLMTPSLSITPVSTTSNVSSLLASIRPGIEIIPLPSPVPVNIPTSLTVTPIMAGKSGNHNEKQDKKKPKDRLGPGKRKLAGSDGDMQRAKIPFLDNKGRMSPNINMTKKPNSPNLSPSKPMASQGKPSVSTLKSVSSTTNSPKFGEPNQNKPKIKKPTSKVIKNFIGGIGNIPPLKAISSDMGHIKIEVSIKTESIKGGDMKLTNQNQSQMANAALTAALQQAAATLVANAGQKPLIPKKVGLAAVIDKLKSVHSSSEGPNNGDKKESSTMMSAKDYLKVSSAITNDVQQQKKALTANTTTPGQEYMVKGGLGLKLTINKAKMKDPAKSPKHGLTGMKSPLVGGIKKVVPGMKPLSALSAKLASVAKKLVTPTNKEQKDMSGSKPGSLSIKQSKPIRLESEDLTKKLFLPGSVKSLESGGNFSSAPVFNPNKFQIPKKARSFNNGGSNSSSSDNNIVKSSSGDTTSSYKSSPVSFENVSFKEKIQPLIMTNPSPVPMEVDLPEMVTSGAASGVANFNSESMVAADLSVNKPLAAPSKEIDYSYSASSVMALDETTRIDTPASPDEANSTATGVIPNIVDFASPESPDPANCGINASTPQTIPTTPLNTTNEESPKVTTPSLTSTPPTIATASAPENTPEEEDEDQLFIDDESNAQKSISNKQSPTDNIAETSDSSDNKPDGVSIPEDKITSEMPPPPPPTTDTTSNIAIAAVCSPAMVPPASPKPIASPLGATPTLSIASVHIVHSPQPSSPALLRSPMVHASPAASPYAIDDDLMDEALIGGNSK